LVFGSRHEPSPRAVRTIAVMSFSGLLAPLYLTIRALLVRSTVEVT
jgi:hypothetical protein